MKTVRPRRDIDLYTADPDFAARIGDCLPGRVRTLQIPVAAREAHLRGDRPRMLLIDLSENAEAGIRLIRTAGRVPILCFLGKTDQALVQAAIAAGADGVLCRSDSNGRILERIRGLEDLPADCAAQSAREPGLFEALAAFLCHPPASAFRLILGYLMEG